MFALNLTQRGIKYEYEPKTFKYTKAVMAGVCLDCGGRKVGQHKRYRPDFYFPDHGFWIEFKGNLDSRDRTKLIAVLREHPELDLRIVFLADNKLSRLSDTRYSEWAKANNFVHHFGRYAPDEWFAPR